MPTPRPLLAAFAVTLTAAPAAAGWQEDLASQMRWDYDCEVTFLSNIIERDVDDEPLVIAKVHCEDGRVFDALQRSAYEDFEVSECRPDDQAC